MHYPLLPYAQQNSVVILLHDLYIKSGAIFFHVGTREYLPQELPQVIKLDGDIRLQHTLF
jgi:hypothetical protein